MAMCFYQSLAESFGLTFKGFFVEIQYMTIAQEKKNLNRKISSKVEIRETCTIEFSQFFSRLLPFAVVN